MLKKALLSGAAVLFATAAFAANIPNQTFWDPTNALGTINAVIQSINGGVTGLLGTLIAPSATTLTTIQPLFPVTILPNQLAIGQVYHMKGVGVNSADGNVKTVTFAFGAASCAVIVTGSAAPWSVDLWVTQTAAATQSYYCNGQEAATAITGVQGTGTVANNASIATIIQGTAATSGTVTLNQAWAEILR
jgi:hypothetical protein